MSETCIVCLGTLAEKDSSVPHSREPLQGELAYEVGELEAASSPETFTANDRDANEPVELIAHLLPCGHDLHDECLKPWVERANSCPICRQNFNLVQVSKVIRGPTLSSYPVKDKIQVSDPDSAPFIEDLEEEEPKPCPYCGLENNEDVLLLCDSCEGAYHTYCIGLDSVPMGQWLCENCAPNAPIEPVDARVTRSTTGARTMNRQRTRGQQRQQRQRAQVVEANWARVWQTVWDRLNIDLDFPFDDGPSVAQLEQDSRTQSYQRHEWEQRLRVAERQGAAHRFRDTAPALLDLDLDNTPVIRTARPRPEQPEPESTEEISAWNAMEKAREIRDDPAPPRRPKRKSATNSPSDVGTSSRKRKRRSANSSPIEPTANTEPERKLKRPQTRRAPAAAAEPDSGESSSSRARPSLLRGRRRPTPDNSANPAQPSFLRSLLQEVETSAPHEDPVRGSARSPLTISSMLPSDYSSPGLASPGGSPTSSNHPSPRALSRTPPPSHSPRPSSPAPLTSKVEPIYQKIEYSPTNSQSPSFELPTHPSHRSSSSHQHERPSRTAHQQHPHSPRSQSISPTRGPSSSHYNTSPTHRPSSPTRVGAFGFPLSAKAEVQKMVKDALAKPWGRHRVSKDEYTEINRTVSRMLYDQVGDLESLQDAGKRREWEALARREVERLVQELEEGGEEEDGSGVEDGGGGGEEVAVE